MDVLLEKLKKIGLEISKCYQCGTCTGDCPVAKIDYRFNPRKIVLATSNESSVDTSLLWMCATCYKCYRCPRDVKPAEVIGVARKLKAKEGESPKIAKAFSELLKEYGELPEFKLVFSVKGFGAIGMMPFSAVREMMRKGKISFRAKKSKSADEVRRIFEIVGDMNGR